MKEIHNRTAIAARLLAYVLLWLAMVWAFEFALAGVVTGPGTGRLPARIAGFAVGTLVFLAGLAYQYRTDGWMVP